MISISALAQSTVSSFSWERGSPEGAGLSSAALEEMQKELEHRGTKKLLIIKNDKLVFEWFAEGWEDNDKKHYSASLAKALVGGMSLLVTLNDGLIHPDMPACQLIPEWKNKGAKSMITIRQLATHTSGLDDAEAHDEMQQQLVDQGLHPHMDLPGWKGMFWRKDPDPFSVSRDSASILFTPGTQFNYSNPGIGMLSYAVTASLKNTNYNNIRDLLWDRIYVPLGIQEDEITIGYNQEYQINDLTLIPSWGGGSFTANAVARIGRLMLHKGKWEGQQLIDSLWVERVTNYANTPLPGGDPNKVSESSSLRTPLNPYPASTMGWYSNYDGIWPYVPRDAFVGAGAGNQLLMVIPSLDMIVVRFGDNLFSETDGEGFWLGAERELFNPIMDVIIEAPYSPSSISCNFAPESEVIRMAEGSDNWPITWADDDNLYSAYGDGWGFDPKTDIKLSLGIVRIEGSPPNIKGFNLRTNSGERVGQGKFGVKASGLISVNGVLYMLVRNEENSQLAISKDNGETWQWVDWTFAESFGCPTFLNFGRDYDDARDNYVYIYSQDANTAYEIADQMVMARVPKERIIDSRHYEYFAGLDSQMQPLWSEDIHKRKGVFMNPGKCYRSGISYNPGLEKYFWCQIIPYAASQEGPRFDGGLGIFEAPEPWGPWKTVYYTRKWDMGPGETMSIPTKWISEDGHTAHLVFSGNDYFSVREVRFR